MVKFTKFNNALRRRFHASAMRSNEVLRMSKPVDRYGRLYRKALAKQGLSDVRERTERYRTRLRTMLGSPQFANHDVYPTMDVEKVYAVIAMCLELRDYGLSDEEIMRFSDTAFQGTRRLFDVLIGMVDLLPNSFGIVRKWNVDDHAKRVRDHSITYDYFRVTENRIEYKISRCMYVEMFEAYGIRQLCKIFCNTDVRAYAGLTRHVQFVRHSDLSDGDNCFDEVRRK